MRKQVLLTMLFCTVMTITMARQLTPSEALSRMQTVSQSKSLDGATVQPVYNLAYSSVKDGKSTYYVYNAVKGGFVVLSADDCMPAVLMISDSGASFDFDKIPDNMRWWLSQYDDVISEYITSGSTFVTSETKESISPLLKEIAWDQVSPYNLFCPAYNDSVAATGCVATAMAQIMKYHRYPEQGICDHSYQYTLNGDCQNGTKIDTTATSNISEHKYNWDAMLDNYSTAKTYTTQQKEEVAQLMYDCGVACDMTYGYDGSGAAVIMAAKALVRNFGYDKSLRYCTRSLFADSVWEEMVYNELANNRPVLYGGADSQLGGHCFVCDGYADGKYHINWGWSAYMNCYCLLTSTTKTKALRSQTDDGKTNGTFCNNQDMVIGIKPDEGNNDYSGLYMCADEFSVKKYNSKTGKLAAASSFDRSENMYISGDLFNSYYFTQNYALGAKLTGDEGTYYAFAFNDSIAPGAGYSYYTVYLYDVLKNGTYAVTPVYKNLSKGDTQWHEMTLSPDVTIRTVTITGSEPLMCITEQPVITSNGKTTSDNQILKTATGVDMTITLKAKSLSTISAASRYLYAYVFTLEGGTNIASMRTAITSSQFKKGTEKTYILSSSNADNMDQLASGTTYYIEFNDVYYMGQEWIFDYLPNTEYNGIYINIVNEITGIDDVTIDGSSSSTAKSSSRKVLRNGRIVIINNNKEYFIDGTEITR